MNFTPTSIYTAQPRLISLLSQLSFEIVSSILTGYLAQLLSCLRRRAPEQPRARPQRLTPARRRRVSAPFIAPSFASLTDTDPNAPKRGLSAYMFFANDQRDKVREDNPGIKFGKLIFKNMLPLFSNPAPGEVGKLLGEKWKALSDKQRQPYEAKAAADKKRYEEEKTAYAVSFLSTLHMKLVSNQRRMLAMTRKNPSNRRMHLPRSIVIVACISF